MTTRAEYAQLSLTTYHSGEGSVPSGWTQISYQAPTSTGFSATVYQNGNEIVIAYAGTQLPGSGCSNDVVSDLQILLDEAPDQYGDALSFYNTVKNANPNSTITLTGQSLGGSLAQLVGAETGATTTSFNAVGVSGLLDDCNITNTDFSKITNYSLGNDLANIGNIALGLEQLGATYIIQSTGDFPHIAHNDFESLEYDAAILQNDWINSNKLVCDIIRTAGENISALLGVDMWQDFCEMFGLDFLIDDLIHSGVKELVAINKLFKRLMAYGNMTLEYIGNHLDVSGAMFMTNPLLASLNLFLTAEATEPIRVDPILFDLDGDGIETTNITNGTYFDHNNDGFAESSAWTNSDDGILVIDSNSNGSIDNGTELVTSLTPYDTNSDGVINSNDTNFSNLKILKGDGTLQTLTEAEIASINLSQTNTNITDGNGNIQKWISTYTKTDSTTAAFGDYDFSINKTYSIATDWVGVKCA